MSQRGDSCPHATYLLNRCQANSSCNWTRVSPLPIRSIIRRARAAAPIRPAGRTGKDVAVPNMLRKTCAVSTSQLHLLVWMLCKQSTFPSLAETGWLQQFLGRGEVCSFPQRRRGGCLHCLLCQLHRVVETNRHVPKTRAP